MRVGVLVVLVMVLAGCGMGGQAAPSKTTDTRSSTLASDAEKIAFLRRYLVLASPVHQTEFHVVYHDNSGGLVPGPSDWDIQAIMRVAPDEMPRWTDGMQPAQADSVDLAWLHALQRSAPGWLASAPPIVYQRSGELVALFEGDGMVAKRVWTIP
jgi:hypothetical protein